MAAGLIAAVAVAGCGGPGADLFVVTRSGQGPGAALTLRVSDDGFVRCNGGRRLRISDQQLLLSVARGCQALSIEINQERATQERRIALGPNAVAGQQVAVVLSRARRREQIRVELHAHRPVGGQRDQVGALQRTDARRLGESQVVADEHAHPHPLELVDLRSLRTGRRESVDPQEWEMGLGVPEPPPV